MDRIPRVILHLHAERAYDRGLHRGIAKYARLHGPWAFWRTPPFYLARDRRQALFAKVNHWAPTGLITCDTEQTVAIIARKIPTVLTHWMKKQPPPYLPRVVSNTRAYGKMGAEHLLDCGFQRFGFCGFDDLEWSQLFAESFSQRVKENGLDVFLYKHPRSKVRCSWHNEQFYIADWLQSLPKPIGIMACNDERAQQVLESCQLANLHVPEEIGVVGVDNDELICATTNPPLSSIAISAEREGYDIAELLHRLMLGKEKMSGQILIAEPITVVTRQSTNIVAVEDHEVREAVRYIRQNAKKVIHVENVINIAAVSRRSLEQRFRKTIGRSINDEIRRVRIDHVARMLVETNLSISYIASSSGYSGVPQLSRYFFREKGMSPLNYRRCYGPK